MPEDDASRETTDAGALRPAVRRRATPTPAGDEPETGTDAPVTPGRTSPGLAARLAELADEIEAEPAPEPVAAPEPEPTPVADATPSPEPVTAAAEAEPVPAPEPTQAAEPEPTPAPKPTRTPKAPVRKVAVADVSGSEPVKAPAKKAAAKKAPAKTPAGKTPAKAPASKAPAKKAVKAPPAVSGEPKAVARAAARTAAAPAAPAPRTTAPAPEASAAPADTTVVPRQGTAWVRWLLALSLLLVATAVGLGAAAAVEAGPRTFRASAVAELAGGSSPTVRVVDALQAGQKRYAAQVPQLTEAAARAAAVRPEDVRADLIAVPEGTARIVVTAQAADAASARRLARAGVDTLTSYVPIDQEAVVASEGDRLGASAVGPPTKAVRTAPEHRRAAAVGILAGGAVLLLALTAVVLRRGRV